MSSKTKRYILLIFSTFLLQDDYNHSVTLRNLAFKDYFLKKYSALKKKVAELGLES